MFDPNAATNPELSRGVFVGLGAGAVAMTLGKPHPPLVAEDDPSIAVARPNLSTGIPAYAALPKSATRTTPGVVIVQHIWGVDATIRDDVRRFAKAGVAAIAPELFARSHPPSGDGSEDYKVFLPFAQRLDDVQVQRDLEAGASWLRERAGSPNDARPKIGIMGFCMGGGIALRQAWENPKPYDAAVAFYGTVKDQNADFVGIPVMGNYGGRDTGIAPADVRAFFSQLRVQHDLKIYDQAGHAFFDDTRESYVASAAEDAWARTLRFFQTHLRA